MTGVVSKAYHLIMGEIAAAEGVHDLCGKLVVAHFFIHFMSIIIVSFL